MASAAIGAGASLVGGLLQGKGAKRAAEIQAASYQKGIDEQRRQFGVVQANNQPYMAAGTSGLSHYGDLIGLNGAPTQQSAIDALKGSPQFTSEYQTGLDAILQGAAATGGLRGGNTALAQSNFGSGLLAQLIQQQLGAYGGLIQTGQASASGTNSAAMATGQGVANSLAAQGGSQGAAAYAPYGGLASGLQGAAAALGAGGHQFFGGGGITAPQVAALNPYAQATIAQNPGILPPSS